MGKINFTPWQKLVFEAFSKEKNLKDKFYFGGGTALSVFYLNHRLSQDLDFFSQKSFDKVEVIRFVNALAKQLKTSAKVTEKETLIWFELEKGKELIKIDFLNFPYPQIDKGLVYQGVNIDSPRDIGANKLLLLNLNHEDKDYVDLYFLLKEKFTIWDLLYAVESKFKLQLDLIGLGEDFLKVDTVQFLPQMIKPLTLPELKGFFKERAKELGKKVVV